MESKMLLLRTAATTAARWSPSRLSISSRQLRRKAYTSSLMSYDPIDLRASPDEHTTKVQHDVADSTRNRNLTLEIVPSPCFPSTFRSSNSMFTYGHLPYSTTSNSVSRILNGSRQFSSVSSKSQTTIESLNFRARAKLDALSEAKEKRRDAKRAYEAQKYDEEMFQDEESQSELSTLFEEWQESESQLWCSYQHAIKYVARTRKEDAALNAQTLLNEMIERAGAPATEYPLDDDARSEIAISTKPKIQVMAKMLADRNAYAQKKTLPDISQKPFPPPERRDFLNVLRSWYQSKARKKGQYAEALLLRMAELASWYPNEFDTLPDSKHFAMVANCHAGSTHSQSLKKIVHLHAIHSIYAQNEVKGVNHDDPFFLLASMKGLKNYRKKEELELGELWLSRLHSFVTNPANSDYVVSKTRVDDKGDDNLEGNSDAAGGDVDNSVLSNKKTVNVSSAYTRHIRELARLRGADGAAAKARITLDQMHELAADQDGIGSVEIKANAYNLVIGLYRDSKIEGYAQEAVYLLDEMVSKFKEDNSLCAVPCPNSFSFEFCIKALTHIKDAQVVVSETERILNEYESMCDDGDIEGSTKPYNAALEVLTDHKSLRADRQLLSRMTKIVARMNNFSKEHAKAKPDVETSSLILKACSFIVGDLAHQDDALKTANDTFQELEESEARGDSGKKMTYKCYFRMMRCISNFIANQDEKRERIKQLFSDACQKGVVNADILKVLRNTISEEDYIAKVGEGRIADNWIANVPGVKALYTDGTTGGEGKNARRKGKSTSNWAKKQRRKEEEHFRRREAKVERKRLRKQKQKRKLI